MLRKQHHLFPKSLWSFPQTLYPYGFFEDEENGEGMLQEFSESSGLSVSEDDKFVYVEAALPGIHADEIEMTYNKGVLWIKAEKKEEKTGKKYYRKASSSYSYHLAVPGDINEDVEPDASYKDGILIVTFTKSSGSKPKKISIKKG